MSAPLLHPDGLIAAPGRATMALSLSIMNGRRVRRSRAYEKPVPTVSRLNFPITILRKRENFRRAFDDFQPEKIARYDARKKAKLMQDAGIVRNRLKIDGAVLSARAYLEVMEKGPGFATLLWDFLDGKPKLNKFRSTKQVLETALSRARRRNFRRAAALSS
jgi:DNA-3-methyladenine glycosylase I